jgi:CHASE3 domain sensor protein
MTKKTIGYILFAIALLIIAAIQISAYRNARELLGSSELLSRTYEVMNQILNINLIMSDAQSGRRGFAVTNDERFLEPYYFAQKNMDQELERLKAMTLDNTTQQQNVQELKPLITAELDRQKILIDLQRQNLLSGQIQRDSTEKGVAIRRSIRKTLDKMRIEENRLLQLRNREAEKHSFEAATATTTGTILSFALMLGGFYLLRQEATRRVEVEKKLVASGERFRALASHLQFIREEERAKIAREIHDELGQVLTVR